MIEIKNLTKVYKLNKKQMKESKTKSNRKVAVDHLSLNAHKGEIYGLLGPNGAGKTTTLRCIATIIKPTEGEVKVAGHDVVTEAEQVRKSIGFLTSDIKLDPQFTPDYMFEFFGRLHGVSKEVLKERKEQLFEYFGIKDFAHKQIKELSTGMKQKAAIAVSLVHDPEIVIFDEPTSGLDLKNMMKVSENLVYLQKLGITSFIITHDFELIMEVCSHVLHMEDGKIIDNYKINEEKLGNFFLKN